VEFISRGGNTTGPRSLNLPWLFYDINRFNWESILSNRLAAATPWVTYLFLFTVILALILVILPKRQYRLFTYKTVFIYWLLGIIGAALYKGQLHYHYFEFLFPAPFLVIGAVLSGIKGKFFRRTIIAGAIAASALMIIKSPGWAQGSRLIDQTDRISREIIKLSSGQPFNFALITPGNSDHAYRFFLEKNNHTPVPIENQVTSQLIIVCEQDTCQPLGHPLWEIAAFGRAEIDQIVPIQPGISLYKLIHHPDSVNLIGKPGLKG
jgi:hypothetical protein